MNEYYERKLAQISSDPYQLKAFCTDSNTVVIAGPGSGKTTVLTLKVMNLLTNDIYEPRGLACLTYSNEAAREFKERLELMGLEKRRNVFLGTVHSFCMSEIIIPFADSYPEYNIPVPLRVISEKEKQRLFKRQRYDEKIKLLDVDKERSRNIVGISNIKLETSESILNAANDFENVLEKNGYLDFISMVKKSVQLVKNEVFIQKSLEARFPWIIVDEYQDLGRPLHELILALLEKTNIKIFAVGDTDQSIYDFQGAAPDYLIELSEQPSINTIRFLNNYRSSQDIVDASECILRSKRNYIACGTLKNYNAVIEFHECSTGMEGEYSLAVEQIEKAHEKGIPYQEIAVLFSTNNQTARMSEICSIKGIPFYVSKQEFRITEFVLWLRNCANWVTDRFSSSFDVISNDWVKFVTENKLIDISDRLKIREELYEILMSSKKHISSLYDWLSYLDQRLGFELIFKESSIYPDEIDNWALLFKKAETNLPKLGVDYIERLGKPDNQVLLSTRHSSKGLEFDVVIMPGMEKDIFPSFYSKTQRQLDEQTRICFVALSRARKECHLIRSTQLLGQYGWFPKEPSPFWTLLKQRIKTKP